ncbi:MAG TPA: TMEM175 family protein [Candidatus Dormibacteraeota bacterium]|nr:TMEM175 family protein [Candidatus Dormibacteraeota bacterium]
MAEEDEERLAGADADAYDVGRLLALSDGVFAIAMTLLVLDVPIPRLAAPTDAALLAALQGDLPNLASFALSFALVAVYWVAHRRLLRGLVRTDTWLVGLNLAMLLLVCVVPFAAGLLSRYGDLTTAVVAYAANLVLLGLLSTALQVQSWRGRLLADMPGPAARRRATIAALLRSAVFAASIPIAFHNPTWGEYTWVILPVSGPVARRLLAARSRAPGRRAAPGRPGS